MKETSSMEKSGGLEYSRTETTSIAENSKWAVDEDMGDFKTAKVTFLMDSSKKVFWQEKRFVV